MVFGAVVATNALGGLLFHGVRWSPARWVHDLAIVAVLVFIAVHGLAVVRGWARPRGLATFAALLAASGVLLGVVPDSAYVLFAAAGVAAGWLELAEHRRELPLIRREGLTARRVARLAVLGTLALAATAFFVGRSGAPLCDPASAFQWHAVWHVLSALAMALYAHAAIELTPSSPELAVAPAPRR